MYSYIYMNLYMYKYSCLARVCRNLMIVDGLLQFLNVQGPNHPGCSNFARFHSAAHACC